MTHKLFPFFSGLLLLNVAISCSAQTSKSKLTEQEFKKFDGNESGWLSGKELIACNCKSFDTDGDNEVTKEEFFSGKGVKLSTTAAAPAAQPKAVVNKEANATNNGKASADIKGTWWHSTILYADGKTYKMSSRQSSLVLQENSRYVLNTWLGGANNMRTAGKWSVSGNKLTLLQDGGQKFVYTYSLTDNGQTISIKSGDGSGYLAERSKK